MGRPFAAPRDRAGDAHKVGSGSALTSITWGARPGTLAGTPAKVALWKIDYIYLSFTNSIAFSPTDVMPLTRWAKVLMLLESGVSAITVLLVTARSVNLFK